MRDLAILKAACDAIIADSTLQPKKDAQGKILETFCNVGAQRVANAMGCRELDRQMADGMYSVMALNASKKWNQVLGSAASLWAQSGGLAFAAMTSLQLKEAHGHIAAIYPAPMEFSGSMGHPVPLVANVGKTNAKEKESMAFPVLFGEPEYFTWNG